MEVENARWAILDPVYMHCQQGIGVIHLIDALIAPEQLNHQGLGLPNLTCSFHSLYFKKEKLLLLQYYSCALHMEN